MSPTATPYARPACARGVERRNYVRDQTARATPCVRVVVRGVRLLDRTTWNMVCGDDPRSFRRFFVSAVSANYACYV